MHNSGTLCHRPGGIQLEQRSVHYRSSDTDDSITEITTEAETWAGNPL